jgi:ribonuclease P protein component
LSERGIQSFRPEDRIRRGSRYKQIYGEKNALFSRTMVIYHAAAEGDRSRIGLTVSRKIGNAVVRNRVKRRLREVFRTNRLALARPLDLVVNAKKSIRDADFRTLEDEFRIVIKRLNRYYGKQGQEKPDDDPARNTRNQCSETRDSG